ncbi:MAG TPA: carbamoyltransferase HypF [bacterium]|nr:carbamoyltransferase HypF [bacterium]
MSSARISVYGIVQGVGFRPFVHRAALRHRIEGRVFNRAGSVVIDASGKTRDIKLFYNHIIGNRPAAALITSSSLEYKKRSRKFSGFSVAKSLNSAEIRLIPPDIRICAECEAEFGDAKDRRHSYPFINCTNCGPRFTIIKDTPYDRKNTSMAPFKMCAACEAEYKDISDRRYHAEPNACAECGPSVRLLDSTGKKTASGGKALAKASALLKKGKILAVKSIGGFHMAVDAKNSRAVELLKKRKRRTNKPLAVMFKDIKAASKYAVINKFASKLLKSPSAPIAILPARGNNAIIRNAAPGMRHLGVFLPYAPLHFSLFNSTLEALIMTSGNISEEPIQYEEKQAVNALSKTADYYLVHDRDIVMPADDSVVKPYGADRAVMIRRSRGCAPAPVLLRKNYPHAIGAGPLLKNTFCFLMGRCALMSQHIGDMENRRAHDYYLEAFRAFERFYSIKPAVIACDLHPDYLSSRFAAEYASRKKIPLIKVQHHYSHMLSVMAENGYYGKALGIILDGTGYGADGSTWGGEFLAGDFNSFKREAHFDYMKLPGGDAASTQGYRAAISVLSRFMSRGEITGFFKGFNAADILDAVGKGVNTPLSSGAGRLFDAAASILGICHESTYEAEAPMRLEAAAYGIRPDRRYSCGIREENGEVITDFTPVFKALYADRKNSRAAANFHSAFIRGVVDTACRVSEKRGIKTMALSGGVFQNTIVLEGVHNRLIKKGFNVLIHKNLSPNDSSIAFGQAVYAAEKHGICC